MGSRRRGVSVDRRISPEPAACGEAEAVNAQVMADAFFAYADVCGLLKIGYEETDCPAAGGEAPSGGRTFYRLKQQALPFFGDDPATARIGESSVVEAQDALAVVALDHAPHRARRPAYLMGDFRRGQSFAGSEDDEDVRLL